MDSDKIPIVRFPDASPYVAESASSVRTEAEARARKKAIDILQIALSPHICASDAAQLLTLHLLMADAEGYGRGLDDAQKIVRGAAS